MGKDLNFSIAVIIMLLSFSIGWFVVFGKSVFLNTNHFMDQRAPVSSISPIGVDYRQMLTFVDSFRNGNSPYSINTNLYPPFTTLFFVPFSLLSPDTGYIVLTCITLIIFFVSFFITNTFTKHTKNNLLLITFFFITGIFSYGFLFELERGQFNMLALFFLLLSIFFYKRNKLILTVILFSIAVQLKLYPFLFILFFLITGVLNKKKLLFISLIIIINIACLFLVGKLAFHQFLNAIISQSQHPFLWVGNHSLFTFCHGDTPYTFCHPNSYFFYLGIYIVIIILSLIIAKFKHIQAMPYLFVIFGCGMLLIPSVSNDYTLIMLPFFVMPFIQEIFLIIERKKEIGNYIFLAATIFLYALCLFSPIYTDFPYTTNKAPILFFLGIIGIIAMLYNAFIYKKLAKITKK